MSKSFDKLEEKLKRRKDEALYNNNGSGRNMKNLASASNKVAVHYYKNRHYKEALEEYFLQAKIFNELGDPSKEAFCHRMIGEMYLSMAKLNEALVHVHKCLDLAIKVNDRQQELRAKETLGRIYVLQGGATGNKEESTMLFLKAEKAFLESLHLSEICSSEVTHTVLMDIQARLYHNLGDVQEHLGFFDKAIDYLNKAKALCLSGNLYEVLHHCYTTEASMHSNKKDYEKAQSCLNSALAVASGFKDMSLKTCATLALKADVLCKMSDYRSARKVLIKAWNLKTPDKEEQKRIEANLKVVVAMCETLDLLASTNVSDYVTYKKLYEKLGDGASCLKDYTGAADYYLKILNYAKLAGDSGKKLAPIYVSLYQTYKDMGYYTKALVYGELEYALIKNEPKEATVTLRNIAEILFLAKKPYSQVEKACHESLLAAQQCKSKKYEIIALQALLKYQEYYGETNKMEDVKSKLQALMNDNSNNLDDSGDEQSSVGDAQVTTQVGDDVRLENLPAFLELSQTKDQEAAKQTKRQPLKKNYGGETSLHLACKSGNKSKVEALLAQGHPVNIRDNAGWLPLHEACIRGQLEVAKILISHGADVNDRGSGLSFGSTPLHDAASTGHLRLVQLLLEKGAKPYIKNAFNQTPFDLLKIWRTKCKPTIEIEMLYNEICSKVENIENTDGDDHEISETKPIIGPINGMSLLPGTSKMSINIQEVITIDSDNETIKSQNNKKQTAIPHTDTKNQSSNNKTEIKWKNAVLAPIIMDECKVRKNDVSKPIPASITSIAKVDDDLGVRKQNAKKRKLSNPATVFAKKPSFDKNIVAQNNINQVTECKNAILASIKNESSFPKDNVNIPLPALTVSAIQFLLDSNLNSIDTINNVTVSVVKNDKSQVNNGINVNNSYNTKNFHHNESIQDTNGMLNDGLIKNHGVGFEIFNIKPKMEPIESIASLPRTSKMINNIKDVITISDRYEEIDQNYKSRTACPSNDTEPSNGQSSNRKGKFPQNEVKKPIPQLLNFSVKLGEYLDLIPQNKQQKKLSNPVNVFAKKPLLDNRENSIETKNIKVHKEIKLQIRNDVALHKNYLKERKNVHSEVSAAGTVHSRNGELYESLTACESKSSVKRIEEAPTTSTINSSIQCLTVEDIDSDEFPEVDVKKERCSLNNDVKKERFSVDNDVKKERCSMPNDLNISKECDDVNKHSDPSTVVNNQGSQINNFDNLYKAIEPKSERKKRTTRKKSRVSEVADENENGSTYNVNVCMEVIPAQNVPSVSTKMNGGLFGNTAGVVLNNSKSETPVKRTNDDLPSCSSKTVINNIERVLKDTEQKEGSIKIRKKTRVSDVESDVENGSSYNNENVCPDVIPAESVLNAGMEFNDGLFDTTEGVVFNRSKSKTPVKSIEDNSPPSTSETYIYNIEYVSETTEKKVKCQKRTIRMKSWVKDVVDVNENDSSCNGEECPEEILDESIPNASTKLNGDSFENTEGVVSNRSESKTPVEPIDGIPSCALKTTSTNIEHVSKDFEQKVENKKRTIRKKSRVSDVDKFNEYEKTPVKHRQDKSPPSKIIFSNKQKSLYKTNETVCPSDGTKENYYNNGSTVVENNEQPIQQTLPPVDVKVYIEDEVLAISMNSDTIHNYKISWLVQKVKNRYYKLKGICPLFNLMTSDGTILPEDSPLNLVLSSPELKAHITKFESSFAEKHYLNACDTLEIHDAETVRIEDYGKLFILPDESLQLISSWSDNDKLPLPTSHADSPSSRSPHPVPEDTPESEHEDMPQSELEDMPQFEHEDMPQPKLDDTPQFEHEDMPQSEHGDMPQSELEDAPPSEHEYMPQSDQENPPQSVDLQFELPLPRSPRPEHEDTPQSTSLYSESPLPIRQSFERKKSPLPIPPRPNTEDMPQSTSQHPETPLPILQRVKLDKSLPDSNTPTDHHDPVLPSQSVCITEPKLYNYTLQLQSDGSLRESRVGPPIHSAIAKIWIEILSGGLEKEVKDQITKVYSVPSNCELLLPPSLNPEIKAAICEDIVEHDSSLMERQEQLGLAISALGTSLNSALLNETLKQIILKPISDACCLLCDIHFHDTRKRRNYVIYTANPELQEKLENTVRGNQLFEDNVTIQTKTVKSERLSGAALKNELSQSVDLQFELPLPRSPRNEHEDTPQSTSLYSESPLPIPQSFERKKSPLPIPPRPNTEDMPQSTSQHPETPLPSLQRVKLDKSLPDSKSPTDHHDPVLPSQSVCITEPKLDDYTLQLLSDGSLRESRVGPPIHSAIAKICVKILSGGLQKEVKDQITKVYSVPANCELLLPPTLNPEIKAAICEDIVEHDSSLMERQEQLGLAISALGTALNSALLNETLKQFILKPISDACRLLCDIHFHDTRNRRNYVIYSANPELQEKLENTVRGNQLFEDNVTIQTETVKSERLSGAALKNEPNPNLD